VEKYCRAGQDTDDNVMHVHCMMDTYGYKHTLRMCNTHCFSTTTMVAQKCLNVAVYVHCLPCIIYVLFLAHGIFRQTARRKSFV